MAGKVAVGEITTTECSPQAVRLAANMQKTLTLASSQLFILNNMRKATRHLVVILLMLTTTVSSAYDCCGSATAEPRPANTTSADSSPPCHRNAEDETLTSSKQTQLDSADSFLDNHTSHQCRCLISQGFNLANTEIGKTQAFANNTPQAHDYKPSPLSGFQQPLLRPPAA